MSSCPTSPQVSDASSERGTTTTTAGSDKLLKRLNEKLKPGPAHTSDHPPDWMQVREAVLDLMQQDSESSELSVGTNVA